MATDSSVAKAEPPSRGEWDKVAVVIMTAVATLCSLWQTFVAPYLLR